MIGRTEIVIEVEGVVFSGWTNVTVEASLDAVSRSFFMDVADGTGDAAGAIGIGSLCTVYAVEDAGRIDLVHRLATGYVDNLTRSLDGGGETLQLSGRDKTADLVDCSAVVTSSAWTKQRFSRIVADLTGGFGVPVVDETDDDPVIEGFALQAGETVFAAVERLCRARGVLPIATADGRLLLTYAGADTATQALVVGDNVISVSVNQNWQDRFSEYTGKAIASGKGKKWKEQNLRVTSYAVDGDVSRYRPMVFIAENRQEKAVLDKRVWWEAQVRAGRSEEVTVEVADFFQLDARGGIIGPWALNERANLVVERWGLEREMLISGLAFSMGTEGRRTRLTLRHPDTYKADPTQEVSLR